MAADLKLNVCAVAVVLCMLVVASMPMANGELDCSQVLEDLSPCASGRPTEECCDGVETLFQQAQTKADRQEACRCLQNLAAALPQDQQSLAENILSSCKIPFKFDPSMDCSKLD
ncbi:hypothetical protein PTKIN_Ptkin09bG0291100 [Pterospermum kingtungense]